MSARAARLLISCAVIAAALLAGSARPSGITAQPAACGRTDRGTIAHGETVTGRVDDCTPEEVWSFDGVRGQRVTISLARPSPPTFGGLTLDPLLRLLAPSGAGMEVVEEENDDGGIGPDALIDRALRETGRYRIVATRYEDSFGDYTLTFTLRGAAATDRGTIEPGETVVSRVDADNPEDAWWFDGVRGDRVLISMERPRPLSLAGITLDPYLFLFAPDGVERLVVEEEDDDGGDGVNSLIVRTLEQTGRYLIVATRVGDSFGDYWLTLRTERPPR